MSTLAFAAESQYWKSANEYRYAKEAYDTAEKRLTGKRLEAEALELKIEQRYITRRSTCLSQVKGRILGAVKEVELYKGEIEEMERRKDEATVEMERITGEKEAKERGAEEAKSRYLTSFEGFQTEKAGIDSVHISYTSLQSRLRELQSKRASLQACTTAAYQRNDSLGQKVTQLTLEKSSVQSNLSALEQLLDGNSAFKAPRPIQQIQRSALMSQAVEPLENVCAVCNGPLFGKTLHCARCSSPMHWHCLTNRDQLCLSCFSS